MSSNIHAFDLALKAEIEDAPEMTAKVQRALALEALRGVVLMTPVDTGRARGNWQVTHDTPASGELDVEDKGGRATIAKGAAEVARIRPYEFTWLANNLPYIESLEKGSSKQAPLGMVGVTAARLSMIRRRTI